MVDKRDLAEKFRAVANSKEATRKLAEETIAANPGDSDLHSFVNRFKNAANPQETNQIVEEIKQRNP